MGKEDHYSRQNKCRNNNNGNDYDLVNTHINSKFGINLHQPQQMSSSSGTATSNLDRLSFADVMQFSDFGHQLCLNRTTISKQHDINGTTTTASVIDPVYFLKFPVLNDVHDEADLINMVPPPPPSNLLPSNNYYDKDVEPYTFGGNSIRKEIEEQTQGNNSVTRITPAGSLKNKRKRPTSVKTSEEVESQRMTHIAVERNRRKQMNEHLRVLRSLMPGSYVQRGDQASIIGGAIEFVRELEQLLQCLESQKHRRIYGDNNNNELAPDNSNNNSSLAASNIIFNGGDHPSSDINMTMNNDGMGHAVAAREERAENKSSLADVEVKLLGFDANIKILCRRRPGLLIKTIAALEDLQLNIIHTNITTIEQTVLYSFNVKVASDLRLNAEDIASSVQQIFSFIHATSNICYDIQINLPRTYIP